MRRILFSAAVLVAATAFMTPAHPTTVADAAQRGDVNTVKTLVKQGADVNVAQGDGMTALHWAAERGDAAMADVLLRAHAKVAVTTRIGSYTPLHLASRSGNAAIVEALLNAGADPEAKTLSGATPLHLAAAAGNADAIKALLAHHANPNAKENDWGQTPLIFAAEYNRADAIRALLQGGADPSIHTSDVNLTQQAARDQAATKRRNEVLLSYLPPAERDSILKAAARAPARGFGGGGGGGGAFAAAPGTVANPDSQLAANAAAVAAPGRGGRGGVPTPPTDKMTSAQIQAAIDSGRKVLESDAGKGPMVEEVDTINGGVAGYVGSVGAMGGLTALHHAARQGNVDAAIALIEGGANVNDTSYADHTTPLLMATINGQFDVAMALVQRHADPNIANKFGDTPLNATINQQWSPKSRYPQPEAIQNQKTTYLQMMAALLDAGANPNSRMKSQPWYFVFNNCGNANCGLENIEGSTPFWRAAYAVDVDAMKLLIDHGADPNIPAQRMAVTVVARGGRGGGRGGRGAPGDSAAGGGRAVTLAGGRAGRGGGAAGPPPPPEIDSLAKIAPVGAGVYAIHAVAGVGYGNGFAGNSHRHAPDGWMPAMRYMVEVLHADVNARDQQGFTPLHHAAARGDNEMILYLVAHGADVRAVSRTGKTTVDMANGPVQRLRPYPETIALLEKLGAVNTHRCVSC